MGGEPRAPGWIVYVTHSGGERDVPGTMSGWSSDGNWHPITGLILIPADLDSDGTAGRFSLNSGTNEATIFDVDGLALRIVE